MRTNYFDTDQRYQAAKNYAQERADKDGVTMRVYRDGDRWLVIAKTLPGVRPDHVATPSIRTQETEP